MDQPSTRSEYLVISRGKWDQDASAETIQDVIDRFYTWHDRLVAEGKMKSGCRLAPLGKVVSRQATTDGPYTESKEIVGGYWFLLATSLDEAARLMAQNPCLALGLSFEIRPLDPSRASAQVAASETLGRPPVQGR